MKANTFLLVTLLAIAVPGDAAFAQAPGAAHDVQHRVQVASRVSGNDPLTPVHIVTSREVYELGVRRFAKSVVARRDSLGNELVIAELQARQLADVSQLVHDKQHRCGGYFAFGTRVEAETFLRSERAAKALSQVMLAAYGIDNQATVEPWLSSVSEANIYNTITHLSGYQNRYFASPTGRSSAEWIRDTWSGLAGARSDVTTELVACANCSTQPSVVLTIQGAELPDEIVVLGGHLDSIIGGAAGSLSQRAPGADDDASGIATLTEVLRVALSGGWRPRRTVKFMGYAAEEVGLRGSNAIAQSYRTANRNVVGVLQLDMTNYKSGDVPDMRILTDYSNADLKTFFAQLFDQYLAPLGLTRGTYTCGYGCSDHASWTSAGYPSAMMFEGGSPSGHFPYIHTSNDTLANMEDSAQNSVKFARFGLAFLGEMAKTAGGPALVSTDQYLWMVPPASNSQRQGFLRLGNRGKTPGLVTLWGVDAAGNRSIGTVTLTLAASEYRQLNSSDLELGNASKGLTGSIGQGSGDWTVVVRSGLDLEALAYIRTPDGFLTAMHDRVEGDGVDWFVPIFNPADNPYQVSHLRVINTSSAPVSLLILGVDDAGASGNSAVAISVPAMRSIDLTPTDLENGNASKGLVGSLGNGSGKWHLSVSSTGRITVQSLLSDPLGKLTNLSTLPDLAEVAPGEKVLWLAPPASNPQQQGFIRLVNRENRSSAVALWGIDDAGQRSPGTITLSLAPRESRQMNSQDLEWGNAAKGLTGQLGNGQGDWRLHVLTDLDLLPMALIRTPDGFLTTVHETVAGDGLTSRVPIFNPADNPYQVSVLRIVNPNATAASVRLGGVDDAGSPGSGGLVSFSVAAGTAIELSATDLENGNASKGLSGSLGNGSGKWVVTLTSDVPLKVLNLLRDPRGYLTNLSTSAKGTDAELEP